MAGKNGQHNANTRRTRVQKKPIEISSVCYCRQTHEVGFVNEFINATFLFYCVIMSVEHNERNIPFL